MITESIITPIIKRMSFHRTGHIFAGVILTVLVAGCGGADPKVVTTAPAPEKPVVETTEDTAPKSDEVTEEVVADNADDPGAEPEGDQTDSPVIVIAETQDEFDENREREETIRSILEQLQQRDIFTQQNSEPETPSLTSTAKGLTAPSLKSEDVSSEDKIIWSIDAGQQNTPPQEPPVIPNGRDPSLAAEALAAAFALVRDHTDISDTLVQEEGTPISVIAKREGGVRAAILAPLNGRAASIGRDMQYGAELAVFTLSNDAIDLTFHDTSQGINPAMNAAMLQQPDIIIGPLFAENTKRARQIAHIADVPVLSFSNNSDVAGQGAWLLGQTPEQEIDVVLRHALNTITPIKGAERDKLSVGLIVQDNPYGQRISQHAVDLLISHGGVAAEMLTLNPEVLADETALRQSVKNLTQWLPPSSEGDVRPPRFDVVVIAGDVSFALRVAPVLSWYDLDPNHVQYLGTSQWKAASILQEPSLEGGWFASQPAATAKQFQSLWTVTNQGYASSYAMMAFDAVALVSTLDHQHPAGIRYSLTEGPGFNGFSGAFKLTPDGGNMRKLEIRQIQSGGFDVIIPAQTTF